MILSDRELRDSSVLQDLAAEVGEIWECRLREVSVCGARRYPGAAKGVGLE